MPKQILETDRLILREFDLADEPALADLFSDPLVMKYSAMGPISGEKLKQNLILTISKYEETGAGFWAVIEKSSQELVGRIGLAYLELDGENFYEVAYRLKRKFWGKGYATEAARGCAKYAFESLDQPFVRSLIDPENIAAIQVAKRLGMRFEKNCVFHNKHTQVYKLDR